MLTRPIYARSSGITGSLIYKDENNNEHDFVTRFKNNNPIKSPSLGSYWYTLNILMAEEGYKE